MKKSLSLLLAITLVVSMFASVVSAADKSAGETLKDLGVITGTSQGLQEDAEWLRKDVTILLSRLFGVEAAAKAHANTHGFGDLNAKAYNGVVSWAKAEGLFNGKTETTFGPNDNITNGQFATVILRALGQDQKDEAKNLEKAIELKLLPEGTVQTDAAKRGATYDVIVAALSVEVDGGKTLGNKLGLKGYEVIDLAIESASAAVAKTVTVNFNDTLAAISNTDVTVVDANGASVPVEKVTVDGKVATISLATALAQKAYTVKIAKATSKAGSTLTDKSAEFTYAKGVPASVAFKATTVAKGDNASYIVKDANGVDITADYAVTDFVVATSNANVVNGALKTGEAGQTTGFSVVNIKLSTNNEITTGNVTINVVDATALKINKLELTEATGVTKSEIFLNADGSSRTANLNLEVKKQNDGDVTVASLDSATYTSSNPTVVAVNKAATGNTATVVGLQAGTATITVTVSKSGQTATSTLVVTVKKAAEASSFKIDKTNVTLVKGSGISEEFTVSVFDQYGEAFNGATTVKAAVTGTSVTVPASVVTTGSKSTFIVTSTANTGTSTISVSIDGINGTQNVVANVVNAASLGNGYDVVVSATKLDTDPHTTESKRNATSVTVKVYQKDVNGNRAAVVGYSATADSNKFTVTSKSTPSKLAISAGAEGAVINPNGVGAQGKETVEVKVNGVLVGSYEIELAPTSAAIVSKVEQNKTSISVSGTGTIATADLIGSGKAFTAYNQYGDVVAGTIDSAISSNDSVITGGTSVSKVANGTALVTFKINGQFFTLTIVVE